MQGYRNSSPSFSIYCCLVLVIFWSCVAVDPSVVALAVMAVVVVV